MTKPRPVLVPMPAPTRRGPARWLPLFTLVAACTRRIEDDSVPEHRIEPCETWCAMMFDPVCPAQEVEVPTEEECVEACFAEEGVWAPIDGVDQCAATHIPYVDCLAELSCEELQGHFAAANSLELIPASEWPYCGPLARAQLDCQSAHY